jgi:hypothetical protein
MSNKLEKGMDSGPVPQNVREQVFVDGLGICAAQGCENRLMQNRTKLGECAHIIPRVVGSHPREDGLTPLEDRKKEANLIYLCQDHHTAVDDKRNADLYPADLLRKWKQDHEIWAAGVTKNSPYLPQDLKEIVLNIGKDMAKESQSSEAMIRDLLDTCRDFLHRNLVKEVRVFLSRIDIFLLKVNNPQLNAKADLINAIVTIRQQRIPEAKKQLLQIIRTYPHDVEAMLEYVELCSNVPEPDDEVAKIENLARTLAAQHPRLQLIDLIKKYEQQELIELEDVSQNWAVDQRLNARFIRQYALFAHVAQKTAERDALVNRWEKELPDSPYPHAFRVLFRLSDFHLSRSESSTQNAHQITEIANFSRQEREKASSKDPLSFQEEIRWFIQEANLELNLPKSTLTNFTLLQEQILSRIEQCYFDKFIDAMLLEFLSMFRLGKEQWQRLIKKIQESKMIPSERLVEYLFLQTLPWDTMFFYSDELIQKYSRSDLRQISKGIREGDVQAIVSVLNPKNVPIFCLLLLEALPNKELVLALTECLELASEYEPELRFTRLKTYVELNRDGEALKLFSSFQVDKLGFAALHLLEIVSSRNQQWHLYIPAVLKLKNFDLPQMYKTYLDAGLAVAYSQVGDDTNAILYAKQALNQHQALGEENAQKILYILAYSYLSKGLPDEACGIVQEYRHIKRSFQFLLDEATLYLKSSFINKYETALSLILQAFESIEIYQDEFYLNALTPLIEIANAEKIPFEDEASVEDGLFVKIDGFTNGWFYLGDKSKSLGAEPIQIGSPRYQAVIHKHLSDEVQWPADRFAVSNIKRRILHIASAPSYLSWRAHEVMENMASLGNAPIWKIQILKEDDSLHLENFKRFYEEHLQTGNGFFEIYAQNPNPFAFLCATEGGIIRAMSRITTERKGFIHCNYGTIADINAQETHIKSVLAGKPCFIDGLSSLVLAEANLLEQVVRALPNLGVPTSVIRLLRDTAAEIDAFPGSAGKAVFIEGNFTFVPKDQAKEDALRDLLLDAANLLDNLPNKVIGRSYAKLEGEKILDPLLPDYFVDSFRYAQEQDAYILTDDALLLHAYAMDGESSIPKNFSSISLVKALCDSKQLEWISYLGYFSRLSSYRYHLLPLSSDDMLKTVFAPSRSGLVTVAPRNIGFLNLPLTLSQEYGVDNKTAVNVLAPFFIQLILDETLPAVMADEIFALTIRQSLAKRDRRLMANILFQICQQQLGERKWLGQSSKTKFGILEKQLFGFAQGIDPIVVESPLLLRIDDSKRVN